jgi:thioredoxin reductase/ferredoxin
MGALRRYMHWLHTRWPAGTVEPLPHADPQGNTNMPGVRIVGDLTGIPLLKFASDTGARAVRAILDEPDFRRAPRVDNAEILDLAIIGGGVAGISAAIEAKKAGLHFTVFEGNEPFSTIANFPRAKPIFTYPTGMPLSGGLDVRAHVKEELVETLDRQRRESGIDVARARIERIARGNGCLILLHSDGKQTRARRVIAALGRSGEHRRLNAPGGHLPKVFNRLHDPKEFSGQNIVVVGGGDSALETAIALAACGAHVTLSYRQREFSRPKPENLERLHAFQSNPSAPVEIERPSDERVNSPLTADMRDQTPTGSIHLLLGSVVEEITPRDVRIRTGSETVTIANDAVFTMIGRDPPLAFFRRSGIAIRGEWTPRRMLGFASFLIFCTFIYLWKGGTSLNHLFSAQHWFPFNVSEGLQSFGGEIARQSADPSSIFGTIAISLGEPGFYYSIAYTALVIVFGVRRIAQKRTPYITAQTLSLMAFQIVPLFALPYLVLPWLGHNGWFDHGTGKTIADALFPVAAYSHGREYWRAFGFILAWPLFIWNVFSNQPLWAWLAISFVQTFVLIPLLLRRWGKGAYCGWICSCGALAETLGDAHRHKMPHGPRWNRLNMIGQGVLAVTVLLLALRILGWLGQGWAESIFYGLLSSWSLLGIQLNYTHLVDIGLAGIIGVGTYFWLSGRVWCRFACPLAALMHIYTRFSRYRIFADKKKCISCNVCTTVCHQGIDVMNFANKGLPMEDPQCVRCSACVTQCPTGVLTFGRFAADGTIIHDRLGASPVQMRENAR